MDRPPSTPGAEIVPTSPPSRDPTLLAELARLTPAQRLRLNDAAVRAILKLREAVRRAGA